MTRTPSPASGADSGSDAGLLSLHEAADRLGVHYMTAYRYVRTGRLSATKAGAQWWVDPRDLAGARQGAAVAGRSRGRTRQSNRMAAIRRLEGRLVAGDEPGAWAIIEARLGSGSDPDAVLLDELGLAMRSVGDGWEAGDYTVDDEHRASGVATRLVARLGARFAKRGSAGPSPAASSWGRRRTNCTVSPPPWPPTCCAAAATTWSTWALTCRPMRSPPP
jgi:excisionase family DNA binding protein